MSKSPKYSVVIVNYNGGGFVQGALDSLAAQTERDFEVILVDNASTDGSVDDLTTDKLPAFTLMRQTDNLGFAGGNNRAASVARGRWLVLLNPDAEADPDWLVELGRGAERHPQASMFASAQFDLNDATKLDGAGDCYLGFGVPWRGGFGLPASLLPDEGACFGPCGAGAMYDRSKFLAHAGFDERFFCFCEDVDLAFRFRLSGEICIFLPKARIDHAGGGLSGRVSDFALFHGARNRIWTYAKNMPALLFWATLPGHLALSALILVRGLMTGRAPETWRGMKAGVAGVGAIRSPSKWSPKRGRVRTGEIASAMSWNILRMGRRYPDVRPLDR
ncbi:MAG: glycosyltransferase family 2 protein [Pseudomonadota bacterium]